MQVSAHAKINLALRVTAKRADGFHDIETIFQTISLHDTLTFTPAEALALMCDAPDIPTDERNLVLRAARALGAPPVAIALRKRIPAGGGLGGGSSDAAATLVVLSRMFSLHAPLHELALSLGSDVPFFLVGGTAYATGRGERLTPLPAVAGVPLLLLFPPERVGTARAYAMLRRFSPPLGAERVRAMVDDDLLSHATELVNDFEEPIFAALPHLAAMKTRLYELGAAWAGMSGSGSTIVGAFRETRDRDAALARFAGVRAVAAETTAASPD
jgi:4-diphosphocytidyl-2-C-methyl-D-erythritol kinase